MAKQPITLEVKGKNVEVKLKDVRLSFVDIWEPKQGTDDAGNPTERFYVQLNGLLPKNSEWGKAQIAGMKEAMKIALEAEWGTDKANQPKIKPDARCLRDGELIDEDTNEATARWEGYEGMMYVSANKVLKATTMDEAKKLLKERHPVQILGPKKTAVDKDGNAVFPVLTEADALIYSGCVADLIISVYPYNATGKKGQSHRINATIEAIKFVRHDKPFGGGSRVNAQNAFDEEDGDEDDAAPAGGSAAGDDDPFA